MTDKPKVMMVEEVTFNGLTWVRKQEYNDLSRRLTEAISCLHDEKAGRPLLAKATDRINELEGALAHFQVADAEHVRQLFEVKKQLTDESRLVSELNIRIERLKAEKKDCGCNCGNCPCCWAREDAKQKRD